MTIHLLPLTKNFLEILVCKIIFVTLFTREIWIDTFKFDRKVVKSNQV